MDANLVLEDCFSRSRILLIIWDFNSPLLWSTSRWFTMRKFSEGPALRIGPFQKIQREVIYFIYAVRIAAIYCPKILTYTVNIVKYLVHIISKHPLKALSLMFETETSLWKHQKSSGFLIFPDFLMFSVVLKDTSDIKWVNSFHFSCSILATYLSFPKCNLSFR